MKKVFFFLISIIILSLPLIALAIEYKFGGLSDNPTPCEYVKALYLWGLGIVGSLAVAGIAYGGVWYMIGKVEQGKEIIYSSLLGLLLLFASWLVLYTINPDLATLKCPTLSQPTTAPPPTTPPPATTTPPTSSTDQAVRDQLTAASNGQISVNKTCVDPNSTVCLSETCLDGLQQNTSNGVVAMQQGCGCPITITGGTEPCHSTTGTYNHGNGYKLDLRPDTTLDSYVKSQIGNSSPASNTNYKGTDGNTYRYETDGGAHWDVCYKC